MIRWRLIAMAGGAAALAASAMAAYALGQINALDKRALVREDRAFAAGQAQCAAETAATVRAAQAEADAARAAAERDYQDRLSEIAQTQSQTEAAYADEIKRLEAVRADFARCRALALPDSVRLKWGGHAAASGDGAR
jgi:hypothetical protein